MAKAFSSHEVFYPAAALYAALALPLSVAAMATQGTLFPGVRSPAGHAHEMLVGYALAVVAGNQLGAVRPRVVGALLMLWVAARAAFLSLRGQWFVTQMAPRMDHAGQFGVNVGTNVRAGLEVSMRGASRVT